ncbi:hypothetical protein BJX68DRAFT_240580 [Aspergillus pseudodeflectus]|uniref:Uncharacterized protein n=1 Tax=Aspergillus pseudodeflectus TaxID=176178 RepID=A0ABR4K3B5_9EURO
MIMVQDGSLDFYTHQTRVSRDQLLPSQLLSADRSPMPGHSSHFPVHGIQRQSYPLPRNRGLVGLTFATDSLTVACVALMVTLITSDPSWYAAARSRA